MQKKTTETLILPLIASSVLLVDQISKHLIVKTLRQGQIWYIFPRLASLFQFTYVTNTGAAFGLLPQWGDFFVIIASLVIIALVLYYIHLPDGEWVVRIALGLQLGGALGNLVDRLHRGFVVDFIDLNFWPLAHWPVFNLADTSIVTGVVVLIGLMLWEEWSQARERPTMEHG